MNIHTITNMPRLLALGLVLACLAGCASAAKPEAMVVAAPGTATAFPAPLQHAMCVRNVTGGEATNPMWASKVDNAGFHSALASSLDVAGLGAPQGNCHFPVDANLLGLSQPFAGFDMTVTSHVNYKVYQPSGEPLVLETIDAPFTATMSDAFVGVERLRMANEGSIRTSIQMFLDKLKNAKP